MAGQTWNVANWYAAANGQFTTDSPQCNATVVTPAWPSVSESVLQVRLGVTIFWILALPRVTLGITAKEVNTAGTFPYNHLQINFVLFGWTYSQRQMNTAVRRLRWWSYVPSQSLSDCLNYRYTILETFTLLRQTLFSVIYGAPC